MAEHLLAAAPAAKRWTSEIVRVEWGVMDDHGQVTECPSEHDAREYQAIHGGELVSRATIHTSWERNQDGSGAGYPCGKYSSWHALPLPRMRNQGGQGSGAETAITITEPERLAVNLQPAEPGFGTVPICVARHFPIAQELRPPSCIESCPMVDYLDAAASLAPRGLIRLMSRCAQVRDLCLGRGKRPCHILVGRIIRQQLTAALRCPLQSGDIGRMVVAVDDVLLQQDTLAHFAKDECLYQRLYLVEADVQTA
jgi:hypothetical protein